MKSGKVVVIGDGACGKTCLLEMFRRNKFPEEYIPTVVDNFISVVKYEKNKSVSLAIWDTAGQEDYDTIRPLSYQDTDLILLCYTIEDKKNLENITGKWMNEIKGHCPGTPYFLVALKADIRDDEEVDKSILVTSEEGSELARQINAVKFIECSARTKHNVDQIFIEAAKYLDKIKSAEPQRETCMSCCNWCFCCCGSNIR